MTSKLRVPALATIALVLGGAVRADDTGYLAAACASCHASGGGEPAIPVLAGQDAGKLAEAMAAFASGERASPIMATVAKALTAAEIEALARWFAERKPGAKP